jgi:hypothetical protein
MSDDIDDITQRAAEEAVQQHDLDQVVDLDDDALLDPEVAVLPLHQFESEASS